VKASPIAHAHALYVGAALADAQSHYAQARKMLEECLVLRRGLGTPVEIAATLSTLSLVRLHTGDAVGARQVEEEALRIFGEIDYPIGQAIGLLHLGQIDAHVGRDADAARYFEQCLEIASDLQYHEVESECELMLGQVALEAGNASDARTRFARSLEVCQESEDKRNEAAALWWLGKVELASGDVAAARIKLTGALRAFVAFDMFAELLGCLEDHAELACLDGHVDEALRICAAIDAARERLVLSRPPKAAARFAAALSRYQQQAGADVTARARIEGAAWELSFAVSRAQQSTILEERVAA